MITMSLNFIFHGIGLQHWRVNRTITKNIIEEGFTLIMTGVVRFSMHILSLTLPCAVDTISSFSMGTGGGLGEGHWGASFFLAQAGSKPGAASACACAADVTCVSASTHPNV